MGGVTDWVTAEEVVTVRVCWSVCVTGCGKWSYMFI